MVATLKIAEEEMVHLRYAAKLHSRSLAGQAAHWMRLGRAVESAPDMTLNRVELALKGLLDVTQLNDADLGVFLDKMDGPTNNPPAGDEAIFTAIRRDWEGFSLDENDNLITQPAA